jgi:hypothetical protein
LLSNRTFASVADPELDLEYVVVPRRLQVADGYLPDRQVDPALLDLAYVSPGARIHSPRAPSKNLK